MTRVVELARAISLMQREPVTVQRISAVVCVGENAVKYWVRSLHEAGLVRPAGAELTGKRGIQPTRWEWVR